MQTSKQKHITQREVQWFSNFFGIDLPQYELPFVDFNLFSDVPLYIDPYAITKTPTELAERCHTAIVSYFQALLEGVRSGHKPTIDRLIRGKLAEPKEIHLGVGKKARAGRGIGREQEDGIIQALVGSYAAKTGAIQAIQELELHIPGIGPDKVSDLVANIVLSFLAEFTEKTCLVFGVSTRPCAVSGFWNPNSFEWDGGYYNLPVFQNNDFILVPKQFVRRDKDLMNHRDFYNRYVLEVLQRELLSASDSLVETLRNGHRRVTKKAITDDPRFTITKTFVSGFILEHPDVIDRYRADLWHQFRPADPAFWSGKADEDDPRIVRALERLSQLQPGRHDANDYHETVFELLQFVFDYALVNFEKEYRMDGDRGRIDVIADNQAGEGLFLELKGERFNAGSVPIECKNYGLDLGNQEFNQLADRLGKTTSRFGLMICRSIVDAGAMLRHCTDRWLRREVMILLIDDEMLEKLVTYRLAREYEQIESHLRLLMRQVEYGGQSRL